jgi:hypothetical protein
MVGVMAGSASAMKDKKQALQAALAAVALCGILALIVLEFQAGRKAKAGHAASGLATNQAPPVDPLLAKLQAMGTTDEAPATPPAKAPSKPPETIAKAVTNPAPVVATNTEAPSLSQTLPTVDVLARQALRLVGADPDADAYWYAAINDPSLPAQERQSLIEGLNRDGLSSRRRPSAEDLSLITQRLLLLEEVAPYAMDKVNADAFAEVYRNLMGLLESQPSQEEQTVGEAPILEPIPQSR